MRFVKRDWFIVAVVSLLAFSGYYYLHGRDLDRFEGIEIGMEKTKFLDRVGNLIAFQEARADPSGEIFTYIVNGGLTTGPAVFVFDNSGILVGFTTDADQEKRVFTDYPASLETLTTYSETFAN